MKSRNLETIAVHGGVGADPVTGAISTPIYLTSTYIQDGPGKHKGYEYSRTQNRTRESLEQAVAALEDGTDGIAFGSGSAATATVMALLSAGDHVVCSDDVYGGTYRLFDKVLTRSGLEFSFVDLTRPGALEKARKPNTKALWIETPTNPLLKIIDIAACTKQVKGKGILSIVDNTFATPCLQTPLALGADIVTHSTTKYINGHSDVVGGIVVTSDKGLAERLRFLQNAIGAVPSPMDAWLTLRGLRTLPLRMKQHCMTATMVATWLERHKQVERVIYPGLHSHPQHSLAMKQMRSAGGMVSFVVKGGLPKAEEVLGKVKYFMLAESLGGYESLIEHPALMTHAAIEPERRAELGISDGLIRLSIGLEHEEDLIADLEQALK